jgi:inosine-uridine nucleoside N-ribohydrolase
VVKVLLDTDIGTDIDDAVALAYLLCQKQCDLLGITTVTGEAVRRASLASVLCKLAGREIPILPGAEQPMTGEQKQSICQQASVLSEWPHETEFPNGRAVDFMAETIASHPGEVILLTIGPLTNAGLLFSRHPETARLLKGLVMMAGNVDPRNENPEWNAAGDMTASEIVYCTPVKLHRSVGINVTQQVSLTAEQARQQFQGPIFQPVLDMAEVWFEMFYPNIWFHDPLTAASLFEPELCGYEQGTISIDHRENPGRTLWQPGRADSPHQAAFSVDIEGYFKHFFSVFES